ncbi:MAG: hypothetical protein ACXWIU_08790 [Limisphaerales bacterium]
MIHILLSQPGTYGDIVDYLVARGAQVTQVGPDRRSASPMPGKLEIVTAMLSLRLFQAFGKWRREDTVLVIGWQAIPIMTLIKMGLLRRPARFLVMGCFIHGEKARRIVNRVWQLLRFSGLEFVVFSPGEGRNLVDEVGISQEDVHVHLWRQDLNGRADISEIIDDGSIFAGGFSNRDYDLLIEAAAPIHAPLVIVASSHNTIGPVRNDRTTIHLDLPEDRFELLLARSRVVAMPLKGQGEACGQSVLLRVLRNGKPLIATRHESIEAYLGKDYPGFVRPNDVIEMRAALEKVLRDSEWSEKLGRAVRAAAKQLDEHGEPGADIARLLTVKS